MPLPFASRTLLADVGGTNTRVALAEGAQLLPQTVRRYANAEFAALEDVLRTYLVQAEQADCAAAAVAVAGPVRDGRGSLTNLDWQIDSESLARATGADRIAILNDLQAQGQALGHLDPAALRPVRTGVPASGARLVIGIGTGFNIAPVHDNGRTRLVPAAEAGHATLPVRSEDDLRLSRYLARAEGFASVEDALSGPGLGNLYAWLGEEAGDLRPADAEQVMAALASGSDRRAEAAVRLFVRLLGTVAGDLALCHLPFGGIYLAGGVARAVAPWLPRFGFEAALCDKGRFSSFMEAFPVSVVEDDFAALHGLAHHVARLAG